MTTETINGLHSCKPENSPVVGEIKTFVIEQHTSKKSGKPYLKIKSAGVDYGGEPYRILSAKPTNFTDARGNISFSLEVEEAVLGHIDRAAASESTGEANISPAGRQDLLPDHSPVRPYSALDERQRAIIRQHSQSMAVEVLKLKVTLNELTVEDLTPSKLRQLADYFDNDVLNAAK